jgi:integrase
MRGISPQQTGSESQRAWRTALKKAGLKFRWHDLRHTFVSRLCENPMVSEETIRSLAGHVDKKMLEIYSHIRTERKCEAIRALEQKRLQEEKATGGFPEGAQKGAQMGVSLEDYSRKPA